MTSWENPDAAEQVYWVSTKVHSQNRAPEYHGKNLLGTIGSMH